MKAKSRELLLTTKVANDWSDAFDQRVDELIALVGRVDTEEGVFKTVELMDVYHDGHNPPADASRPARKRARRRALPNPDRPFEFVVFRN